MGLFSKPEPKQPTSTREPGPAKPASPTQPAPATLIGPEAHIKGELLSSDHIHIEGKIEGKVKSTKQITIGEKGQVHAEIEAQMVSIRGKLEGDCVATGKVEITGTGKVFGNITAPRIAVAEGAVFRGASNMSAEQKTGMKPTDERKPDTSKTAAEPEDKKSTAPPSTPGSPPKTP